MTTDNAHYQGTYRPRVPTKGRALTAGAVALLTPMATHNFVPRGVQMLRSIGSIAASLLVCLSAGPLLAGQSFWLQTVVTASCAKTIKFWRRSRRIEVSSGE